MPNDRNNLANTRRNAENNQSPEDGELRRADVEEGFPRTRDPSEGLSAASNTLVVSIFFAAISSIALPFLGFPTQLNQKAWSALFSMYDSLAERTSCYLFH